MVDLSRFLPRPSREDASGPTRRRVVAGAAAGAVSAVVLAACSREDSSGQASSQSAPSTSTPPPFEPEVTVEPADAAEEVNPISAVRVSTASGQITSVTLTGPEDKTVEGEISEDGTAWEATGPLDFDAEYRLAFEIASPEDSARTATGESTFHTTSAQMQADATLNVAAEATYGTGQIIQFVFSEPVTHKEKIEEALSVTGGGDLPGRCRWYSDRMMRYRPEDKWAPNSTVRVQLKMRGMDIGEGMIGNQDYDLSFHTGDKHYAVVDNNDKIMRTYINDQPGPEFPVTLGNSDWPSVVGQLVILEQNETYRFDPTTIGLEPGDPHWYEPFEAHNTSRLTNGGVFIHQALPSAIPVLGVANVSHGCIGMSPTGARYIFEIFRPGDVVETLNTGYPQADPDDGYGDWNIPFEHYPDPAWRGDW